MPMLDEAFCEFLTGANAMMVATRDTANAPTITRPAGCVVSPDRTRVVVYLVEDPADPTITNIRDTGAIALVLARPSNYETYQLKGIDARSEAITDADQPNLLHYNDIIIAEMISVGLTRQLASDIIPAPQVSMARVSFSPCEVYRQTPGPGAGEKR
ncbi:MAG: pyridoxamine 5'-phosphate oxidase family protein [Pseudomonadota bacterium]